MIPMALTDVAAAIGAGYEARVRSDTFSNCATQVRRVATDSRDVEPGDLFFAIPGQRFDGHHFILEAASNGAVACVCRRDRLTVSRAGAEFRITNGEYGIKENGDGFVISHSRFAIPILLVENTIAALGRLAAHYRRNVMSAGTVVVAVTGTNGKTTTKEMIDCVLSCSFKGRAAPGSFNNQIGVPLTILSADANDRYLVVEIGSNAPGEVAALAAITSPDVAVITSIGEAHLEGLGDMAGVAAEKASLLPHLRSDGLAVVNIDRPEIKPYLSDRAGTRLLTVGRDKCAALRVADVHGDTPAEGEIRCTRFRIDFNALEPMGPTSPQVGPTFQSVKEQAGKPVPHLELPMPGAHHATNAAAAFAVARWFGVKPEQIVDQLRSFTPLEGRTRVLEIGGVTIVDDAYNANPASMAAAVETLRRAAGFSSGRQPRAGRSLSFDRLENRSHRWESGRRVFVMGDMLELGPESASFHRRAVAAVFDAGIEVLVAVGPATTEAVRAINHAGVVRHGLTSRAGANIPHAEANIPSRTEAPVGPTFQSVTEQAGKPYPQQVFLCEDAAAATDALKAVLASGDTVWIKGSRAVGLDRVVRELEACFAHPEPVPHEVELR